MKKEMFNSPKFFLFIALIVGLGMIQVIDSAYGVDFVTGYSITGEAITEVDSFMDPIINIFKSVIIGAFNLTGAVIGELSTAVWSLLVGVFGLVAALVYFGLDKVGFIESNPVKVIIALAIALIAARTGGSNFTEQVGELGLAIVSVLIFITFAFVIWTLWYSFKKVGSGARAESISASKDVISAQVENIKARMNKDVTKPLANALRDVKKDEGKTIVKLIKSAEENYGILVDDIEGMITHIRNHASTNNEPLPNNFRENADALADIYGQYSTVLSEVKELLHTDLNKARDKFRELEPIAASLMSHLEILQRMAEERDIELNAGGPGRILARFRRR
jgi:hypothetical protein